MNTTPLLKVQNLRTSFHSPDGPVRAVDGVSFELYPGETLGFVGESGCGKTVACLSILRLIDEAGRIEDGSSIKLRDSELTRLSEEDLRAVRGNEISMVFQEPMTSLNPVWTVGNQIAEAVRLHRGTDAGEARARAIEMLDLVGIHDPERRVDDYPHELSGGMRQRVMIAMALACDPSLLIADEPTTALDVTIQAEILDLLADLQQRLGMAMIFVSHDLGVVSQIAHRVLVMYGGQVVESGDTRDVFQQPLHPYTEGLLRSLPRVTVKAPRLAVLPGSVPNPAAWPAGCRFHPRCPYRWAACECDVPNLFEPVHSPGRASRCWLEEEPQRRVGGWGAPLEEPG